MYDICGPGPHTDHRARICKRLRSPRIDSLESILPAYAAWRRAGKINLFVVPAHKAT
jgi:hypothetical protein